MLGAVLKHGKLPFLGSTEHQHDKNIMSRPILNMPLV